MCPIIKIRLTFRALENMNFPIYAGSALRGLFGKSLRRLCCLAKETTCTACAACSTCPYATLFENGYLSQGKNDDIPNPYVIEPMPLGQKNIRKDEEFVCHQILFGQAVQKLSYVLQAWI
jgi:hypothetical protein